MTAAIRPRCDKPFSHTPAADIKGLKIGIPQEYFGAGVDPQVAALVTKAIGRLEECGATTVPCTIPSMEYALAAYYVTCTCEASSNLARFDGVRYGPAADTKKSWHDAYREVRRAGFGTEVRRRIMLGTYALSSGYYGKYYAKAQIARENVKRDFARIFSEVDVIAGPTMPTIAFKLREKCRPALHVPVRYPHGPGQPCRHPCHIRTLREGRRYAGRAPDHGQAMGR